MDGDAQERWLDRGQVTDLVQRAELLKRLGMARDRGWSMSRLTPDEELPFYEALREYAEGPCTPARVRAITETISKYSARYEPVERLHGELDVLGLRVLDLRVREPA